MSYCKSCGSAIVISDLANVDLCAYSGTWYEMAALNNPFQRDCFTTKAEYIYDSSTNTLQVLNTCLTKNGNTISVAGEAKPVGQGRLFVTFDGIPRNTYLDRLSAVQGNYWVLEVDSCYKWALVGSPERNYAWILSRSPCMPKKELSRLIYTLHNKFGYDISTIKISPYASHTFE